jgi:hypothetical protein
MTDKPTIIWEPDALDGIGDVMGVVIADSIEEAYRIGVEKGVRLVLEQIEAARESKKEATDGTK